MPAAKTACLERACRRVYGDSPQTLQFCVRTYLTFFLEATTSTPFCPSNAARIDRLPACVDALAGRMVVEVLRETVPNYPAPSTLDACSEAQLCGAPFL